MDVNGKYSIRDFEYLNQPPKKYTFEQPKLKLWVESWCTGKVLNLFAGKTLLAVDEYRVDSNREMVADWYGDAYEFVLNCRTMWDTVILDPPYNLRKANEKYEGHYTKHSPFIKPFTKLRNILPPIIHTGGRVITFGYDTTGMGRTRGFIKIAICIVNHKGGHNDTLCVVEEKYQGDLFK